MQIEIDTDEAAVLGELLDSALGDLREEIYKAEVMDYKTALKKRESIINRLLQQVRSRPVVS